MTTRRLSSLLAAWAAALAAAHAQAAYLARPVAVPHASGPAFPQGRRSGRPPDPAFAAEKALDGDPATYCCLLDDTLTGTSADTLPARAAEPVTGHLVFDLGAAARVTGALLTSRKDGGPFNPKGVDFFVFADDNPANNALVADLEHDPDLKPLVLHHTFQPLSDGATESVAWKPVTARYVGLRVNSSYESGGAHYNFQIAEMEFFVELPGAALAEAYVKKGTLQETLLVARAQFLRATRARAPGRGQDGQGLRLRPAQSPRDLAAELWARIRQDFPPAQHRLLEYAPFEWFEENGWLAQWDRTTLEQRVVGMALEDVGRAGLSLAQETDRLVLTMTPPLDSRWLDLCVKAAELALTLRETRSLRRAIADLEPAFPGRYPGRELRDRLDAIERQLLRPRTSPRKAWGAALPQLSAALAALRRDALVTANPLLVPGRFLFVRRFSYSPGWYYADFLRASRFGGALCVLSLPDGKVTELVPQLAGGIFDRYDLSFDGRRVVFGYKAARGKGFRLWEVGTDGSGLRQLTFDPPDEAERIRTYAHPAYGKDGVYQHHTDDFHPCYLPDGGIVFASTRCERGVLCDQGDTLSVNVLYRIHGDGSGLRCLSPNALSESTPSLMNDGRVLYTRWEYVDKGVIAVQALWAMRPDGSGSAEVYGNEIECPPVFIHGRAIPGANHLLVCTATLHHPFAVGPILRLDTRRDIRSLAPITNLTPDTTVSIEGPGTFPQGESFAHLRNTRWLKDNAGPLFADPYPLADPETGAGAGQFFLVACNPDQPWNHPTAYGLWLLDVFGNRVRLHQDAAISCWQPMPLRPRPRPTALASPCEEDAQHPQEATLLLTDVYEGLEGVPRGTVKYLRILEQVARPWAARRFWPHDEALGQHAVVSLCSHIHVKIHHGIVPVHPDGSAYFTVPAGRSLFFQALDEHYMEVQRMRSFVNLQPGERRSCLGCHEPRRLAPAVRLPWAFRLAPARPAPQPGESVPRPLHYPTDVQPLLDQHCVRCHGAKDPQGELDLSGELTTYFNRSYENLFHKKLLAYVQEFYGPQADAQKTNATPLPPRALGSAASKLITVLRKGHEDVKLSEAELVRLITWVDANGPYYGSYFGRRNLMYKDHPDFRPVPTLDQARGLPRRPPP